MFPAQLAGRPPFKPRGIPSLFALCGAMAICCPWPHGNGTATERALAHDWSLQWGHSSVVETQSNPERNEYIDKTTKETNYPFLLIHSLLFVFGFIGTVNFHLVFFTGHGRQLLIDCLSRQKKGFFSRDPNREDIIYSSE